ncbi:MAG: UDP-N-acetylmuramoyl-L-alanyl-D-glutamate--2,6-diaminopimelate ligase [Bacteroidales bacterium]|nr:UDP-N-acetylmuramoyl-L-alanyl-D-glutamate--2,6-diaminopimelate ligase [Bacteroidales bacterium]
MKNLKDLTYNLESCRIHGNTDLMITDLFLDSRQVSKGGLFAAMTGVLTDGHQFIQKAVSKGASAILCEKLPEELSPEIVYIVADNVRVALGLIAARFFNNPSNSLQLVGVTGTNGKTSIVTWLYNLVRKLGYPAGLLSTIRIIIEGKEYPASHTTPDVITLNRYLSKMVDAGCQFAFMEVSSHALDQERVSGLHFEGVVFTNLTRDHLDYHPDFAAYLKAKKRLFDKLDSSGFALINEDDKNGRVMIQNCSGKSFSFSGSKPADFQVKIIEQHPGGMSMLINNQELWAPVMGKYNAMNLIAVYGTSILLGLDDEEILRAISALDQVEGRMETIDLGRKITGIVDYAHTPDALANVLTALGDVRTAGSRIITVVGAGGDRDAGKRPKMTKAALAASDQVILTSDNPRTEDPEKILDDMEVGADPSDSRRVLRISDRRAAIKTAVTLAQAGDIVLVAGKGHETYQEVMGARSPFDDYEELKQLAHKE